MYLLTVVYLLSVDDRPEKGGEDDLASRHLQRGQVVEVVLESPRRLKRRASSEQQHHTSQHIMHHASWCGRLTRHV